MTNPTFLDLVFEFIFTSWLYVGAAASIIAFVRIIKGIIKKEGYLKLEDLLLLLTMVLLGTVLGYVSLAILLYLFKDYYKDFFGRLMEIKVYKTKKYKTEQLLYKEHEDE